MLSAAPVPSAANLQSLDALQRGVRSEDPQALKKAAQQFEALFVQMMLKSMRATVPENELTGNEQTRLYQEMLDSQLAQQISTGSAGGSGFGLAEMIERQLARDNAPQATPPDNSQGLPLEVAASPMSLETTGLPLPPPQSQQSPSPLSPLDSAPVRPALPPSWASLRPSPSTSPSPPSPPSWASPRRAGTNVAAPAPAPEDGPLQRARAFAARIMPYAGEAAAATGVQPHFIVAQAALESGWGRAEPRHADGRPSYNLFGVKAGANWRGAVVESPTSEYINGERQRRVERFRAYDSYAEAFADYARLLTQSPRYSNVLGADDARSFARGLQDAGYATDPAYAKKLESIINGDTLRSALTTG